MARQSAEARAAATLNAGGVPPPPPRHLSKEAKEVWIAVAASKPPDWFDEGAQLILERMVGEVIICRELEQERAELRKFKAPTLKDRAIKARLMKSVNGQIAMMNQAVKTSAVKLRLSVQAHVHWANGKNSERGVGRPKGKRRSDPLLGGAAMWNNNTDTKVN